MYLIIIIKNTKVHSVQFNKGVLIHQKDVYWYFNNVNAEHILG